MFLCQSLYFSYREPFFKIYCLRVSKYFNIRTTNLCRKNIFAVENIRADAQLQCIDETIRE